MAKRNAPNDVIDLTLDSDEDEKTASIESVQQENQGGQKKKKAKNEAPRSTRTSPARYEEVEIIESPARARKPAAPSEDDDILIVDAPAPKISVDSASGNTNTNGDAEIELAGVVNEIKLPHMRVHCTKFKFQANPKNKADIRACNEKHCDLCYCYACDCPVKDCTSWKPGGVWFKNHCNATDQLQEWVNQRHQASALKRTAQSNKQATSGRPRSLLCVDRIEAAGQGKESTRNEFHGPGPFEPENTQAASISSCTTCQKCGWHSKTYAIRERSLRCLKCGRYALKAKSVNNGVAYQRKTGDFFLGTRTLRFRIVSRDPRDMGGYSENWNQADNSDPAWQCDQASLEEEVFKHKLGKRPELEATILLTSEWDEVTLRARKEEGIILDNPQDIVLLRMLRQQCFGEHHPQIMAASKYLWYGDFEASWNKEQRAGKMTFKLYLPSSCCTNADTQYPYIIGAWFNMFPLNLTDISGHIKANEPDFTLLHGWRGYYGPSDGDKQKIRDIAAAYKTDSERLCSKLSLKSGTKSLNVGGITNNDTSKEGTLHRFYKEVFTTSKNFTSLPDFTRDWGKILKRDLPLRSRPDSHCLSYNDVLFARLCLQGPVNNVVQNLDNVSGIMDHLENLGHESELTCEGLNVELLGFQKQSLKWALERESVHGGIQRYFWTRITNKNTDKNSHFFFNPILGRFRRSKPEEVRGGIIAEEMGLGKTVISLALILKNPAPTVPTSGSNISALNVAPKQLRGTSEWRSSLYAKTSPLHPKRGSILSRGTLVICPVSLVGQWIEEAKNKLEDPGLIYPYHGSSRKRDANILAKNAIVVTTYQVIASDDAYHRKKSSDPESYCPPLEQIRWWRIICDEGHCLRHASTQMCKSTTKLVSDHKWIVTGTPVNTSINDLKNQLKFLGIEMVEEMFTQFCGPFSRNRRETIDEPGKLFFFLRNIVMRHSQRQTYRDTNTTLMSLPAKSERSIEITLSKAERKEYDLLDNKAKKFYVEFKANHSWDLSKHYLELSQKLTPMRIACSGGRIPLNDESNDHEESRLDDDAGDEDKKPVARKKKKEVQYSDFCYTAKFKVLLRELKRSRDKDPTSKSLVFCQYSSTLTWLKVELPNHGFEFRTLSGKMTMKQRAKALHDFQLDPPTTIFLLSMRSGNCGINLTEANRVFLMEPAFNPALEQQAIGRVYRLGQKREVEVIRLLVKDSVETRLREFLQKKYGKPSSEKSSSTASEEEKQEEESNIGPVGNVATERPKSKILAAEFDILFGVKNAIEDNSDTDMPDAAASSDFI